MVLRPRINRKSESVETTTRGELSDEGVRPVKRELNQLALRYILDCEGGLDGLEALYRESLKELVAEIRIEKDRRKKDQTPTLRLTETLEDNL